MPAAAARRVLRALDRRLEAELVGRALRDALLDRAARDEPPRGHRPRLADAVDPVDRLPVDLRVEVGVEEDDVVGGGEADAEAACARRADLCAVRRVERGDVEVTLDAVGRAVEPDEGVALLVAEAFEDVERRRVLREDDDAVVVRQQLEQHAVEDAQLARRCARPSSIAAAADSRPSKRKGWLQHLRSAESRLFAARQSDAENPSRAPPLLATGGAAAARGARLLPSAR